jgi:hypothetical protein
VKVTKKSDHESKKRVEKFRKYIEKGLELKKFDLPYCIKANLKFLPKFLSCYFPVLKFAENLFSIAYKRHLIKPKNIVFYNQVLSF